MRRLVANVGPSVALVVVLVVAALLGARGWPLVAVLLAAAALIAAVRVAVFGWDDSGPRVQRRTVAEVDDDGRLRMLGGLSGEDEARTRLAHALGVGVGVEMTYDPDAGDELRLSWPGMGSFVVSADRLRVRWEQ